MLASIFETPINDLTSYYIPDNQYSRIGKKEKLKILLKNKVDRTFFIYELNEVEYFWDILSKEIKN
jgi:hypothetical protein